MYGKHSAYRKLWEHLKGPIPKGIVIRHMCDNGMCVNIEHLELGTRQDNIRDMNERGRARGGGKKGEQCSYAKINSWSAAYIRKNFGIDSTRELAELFGICEAQIRRIGRGERWADLGEQPTREQQFLNKAKQGPYNEILKSHCLEMPTGRQICRYKNKSTTAHRIAMIIQHGRIPEGKMVLHMCNNDKCINHLHLKFGDHAENMKDRDDSGRTTKGVNHGMCRLSEDNVRYIKFNPDKKTASELAKEFDCTKANISRIQVGKTWKNIV